MLGIVSLLFGFIGVGIYDDLYDEKKLVVIAMITTGALLYVASIIDVVDEPEIDKMMENSKRLAAEVSRIKSECSTSAESIKTCRVKKKYPAGR